MILQPSFNARAIIEDYLQTGPREDRDLLGRPASLGVA